MTPHESDSAPSIPKLRTLILVCLVLGVTAFTAVMFSIAQELSSRFGPQVESDLRWRATRGAQELAHASELGLAVGDADMVSSAFGVYATSDDVQAIVASSADGHVLVQHGTPPEAATRLFAGAPGTLRAEPGYLVSWANAEIEGAAVGKIAIVLSTQRHSDALTLLARSKLTVLVGGLLALLLGGVVVTYFTRAVGQRDAQLSDYAKNLERKVDARTRELDQRNRGMRLVLDNVAQGFITIDLHGVMASEHSAVLDRWFSTNPAPGLRLTQYLAELAPSFASWLELGLAQLRDDVLPVELALDQLPKRFATDGRTFAVTYTPIQLEARLSHLLVIISDVTEALARERAEREQRELVALFQRISVDRAGVEEFLAEAANLVAALRNERDPGVQKRLVHTLKGNCAIYGLESYAELAQRIEGELEADQTGLSDEQQWLLVSMWKEAMQRVSKLLGGARRDVVEVGRSELDRLRARAQSDLASIEILPLLTHWSLDPIEPRLERLAQQAIAVAKRLEKPEPKIEVRAHDIRLSSAGFSAFWSAMVHAVRNAVDHGIESARERVSLGKPEAGSLELSATRVEGKLSISVRDDGAGVRWERVRAKAEAAGLPHTTHEDLVEALFADGLSTKEEANDVSGRGVGLAALRQTVRELGGSISVSSTLGKGTCFVFAFEEHCLARAERKGRASISSLLPNFS
jgi:two-component system, chemotaxis family, sensor kinase CheA